MEPPVNRPANPWVGLNKKGLRSFGSVSVRNRRSEFLVDIERDRCRRTIQTSPAEGGLNLDRQEATHYDDRRIRAVGRQRFEAWPITVRTAELFCTCPDRGSWRGVRQHQEPDT